MVRATKTVKEKMKEKSEIRHNSGIDVLRGLAILSVILLHLNIRIPFKETLLGGVMPGMLYKILFWSGFYGVCVFFVISGFLITNSALNKWKTLPDLSLRGFYAMRFARIMPLLVSLLIILSILHLSGITDFVIDPARTSLARSIFAALTFHVNWLEIQVGYLPGSWDILWSLSIEEVFYLFFPIVCFVCRKEWHFVALISVFLIISPFARTTWYPGNELGDKNHFAYLDAISIGCMAALVSKRFTMNKTLLLITAITGWSLFLLVTVFRKLVYLTGLTGVGLNITLLALGTAMILIWMQSRFENNRQQPSKFTGFIRFLGRNSYEVYLTHMFVVFLFVRVYHKLNLSGEWVWGLYILTIIISGLLGDLVARYFSNPHNIRLRKRFELVMTKDPNFKPQ